MTLATVGHRLQRLQKRRAFKSGQHVELSADWRMLDTFKPLSVEGVMDAINTE
jgi:hypothetical protein